MDGRTLGGFYRTGMALIGATMTLTLAGCGQIMVACELNALNARFENRLQCMTRSVPEITIGQPYHRQLTASGGIPPYHWQIEQGELPSGLTLDAVSGIIAGIPQSAFEDSIVVKVSDSSGDSNAYVLKSIHANGAASP